jgi:hypothetical protein
MMDIGWTKDDGCTEFELTMQPHDLMELLMRLYGEAGLVLGGAEGSAEEFKREVAELGKRPIACSVSGSWRSQRGGLT